MVTRAPLRRPPPRLPWLLLASLVAVGAAGACAPAPDLAAIRGELRVFRDDLSAALDSTAVQLESGEAMLEWLEGRGIASSADLVESLRRLLVPAPIPSIAPLVSDLESTGRLGRITDGEVRRGLLLLDRRLERGRDIGTSGLETYHRSLDRHLSPGMWRYVFRGAQGEVPVDFRATVALLDEVDFEVELRALLRGLRARATVLREGIRDTDAVLGAIGVSGRDP